MNQEQASAAGTARGSANGEPVLVITGASTGIGAATARRAAEFGYRVVLAARSEDKLGALAEELGREEKALAVRCDVTSWEDQQALVGLLSNPPTDTTADLPWMKSYGFNECVKAADTSS